MDNQVYWVLELDIREGREEELRALMAEMVEATEANEPGTLGYQWSTSHDGRVCHLYECYVDSDAVLVHLRTFGERFAARFFDALAPTRFTVYGAPSTAVREALAGFGPTYLEPAAGFSRGRATRQAAAT